MNQANCRHGLPGPQMNLHQMTRSPSLSKVGMMRQRNEGMRGLKMLREWIATGLPTGVGLGGQETHRLSFSQKGPGQQSSESWWSSKHKLWVTVTLKGLTIYIFKFITNRIPSSPRPATSLQCGKVVICQVSSQGFKFGIHFPTEVSMIQEFQSASLIQKL